MKLEKSKDILIIFLLITVIVLLAYTIFNQNKAQQISERDNSRIKAQLADGKRNGNDKDVDPYEKNEVKNTILKGAADKIQICYKDWLKVKPNFESGKIALDWQIKLDGSVDKPEIISSDIPDINSCVLEAIGALKFPPPPSEKPWYIVHKFFFKKEETTTTATSK